MLTALIGPITQIAGTWLEGKVEKTKAETGAKVAKAKAEATIMEKKATGEIDWDLFGGLLIAGFLFKVIIAALDTPFLYLGVYYFRKRFKLNLNEEIKLD